MCRNKGKAKKDAKISQFVTLFVTYFCAHKIVVKIHLNSLKNNTIFTILRDIEVST